MPAARPARGGGRWVSVAPERLDGFLGRFAARHGDVTVTADPATVTVAAADGSVAECVVPFAPMAVDDSAPFGGLLTHACVQRMVGLLLVRRGGFAAGVFAGVELVASKVGTRHVQGRAAAGGWSQQRFARRRENQARVALEAAADAVAGVLLPVLEQLDAVVAGGDRSSCDEVLADPRLQPLRPLLQPDRIDVPDPRRQVLERSPGLFRAVRVRISDVDGQFRAGGAADGGS
jgi:hypothetical protein